MILTNWGYVLVDAEKLPDLLSKEEFNQFTANKYDGDIRMIPEIASAESAVRNYVGWHLAGPEKCRFEADSLDVSHIIQLPARYVSDVESVTVGGIVLDPNDYQFKTNGLLRINHRVCERGWNDIVVEYKAGLPESLQDAVKELIMHRVTHALANSYGIQSESSGGVSITYTANWSNSTRATYLPDDNKEVLTPYRLQGVY